MAFNYNQICSKPILSLSGSTWSCSIEPTKAATLRLSSTQLERDKSSPFTFDSNRWRIPIDNGKYPFYSAAAMVICE